MSSDVEFKRICLSTGLCCRWHVSLLPIFSQSKLCNRDAVRRSSSAHCANASYRNEKLPFPHSANRCMHWNRKALPGKPHAVRENLIRRFTRQESTQRSWRSARAEEGCPGENTSPINLVFAPGGHGTDRVCVYVLPTAFVDLMNQYWTWKSEELQPLLGSLCPISPSSPRRRRPHWP